MPLILIVPPLDFKVKAFVSPVSELTVELKSIVPLLAVVSTVRSAVRVTGPSMSMLLPAAL